MFVTLITDCKDDNALGRSTTRLSTLFECNITTIGVNGWDADLEAAGNLIDMLDASEGKKGVILVNVAPRHKSGKKWPNGTPFGYFHYKETLVVISVDGKTLSLVKKFGLIDHVKVMDIPTVMKSLYEQRIISEELVEHVMHTQFRSFEFLPRVAAWLTEGQEIPSEKYDLKEVPDAPQAIWWIDNFGNIKTTLFPEEVDFKTGKEITFSPYSREGGNPSNKPKLLDGSSIEPEIRDRVDLKLICYNRLKDVPEKEPALIIGSSGLGDKRFLEIVVQGVSAEKQFNLKSGQEI